MELTWRTCEQENGKAASFFRYSVPRSYGVSAFVDRFYLRKLFFLNSWQVIVCIVVSTFPSAQTLKCLLHCDARVHSLLFCVIVLSTSISGPTRQIGKSVVGDEHLITRTKSRWTSFRRMPGCLGDGFLAKVLTLEPPHSGTESIENHPPFVYKHKISQLWGGWRFRWVNCRY